MRYKIKRWYQADMNAAVYTELRDCERLEVIKQAIKAIDNAQNFEAQVVGPEKDLEFQGTATGSGPIPSTQAKRDFEEIMGFKKLNTTESIDKRIEVSETKLGEALRWLDDVKNKRCHIVDGIHAARACCTALLNLL